MLIGWLWTLPGFLSFDRTSYPVTCQHHFWWTMGESNSRLSDANRLHCHYANGPSKVVLGRSDFTPSDDGEMS